MTFSQFEEAIKGLINFIDQGSWKYSWHLKRIGGSINWSDEANLNKIEEILYEREVYLKEQKKLLDGHLYLLKILRSRGQ